MSHGADFLAGDSILELSNLGPGPGLPLMRGVSDVTTDSDVAALGPLGLPASVSDQDIPTARWQATSAGLWPVRRTSVVKPYTSYMRTPSAQQVGFQGLLALCCVSQRCRQQYVSNCANDCVSDRPSMCSSQITYADLRFQKQIGEGSFGRVYLAKWRETTVAVKLLHRQAADHQDEDLPTVRTQRDDPILTALQRVRLLARGSYMWSL